MTSAPQIAALVSDEGAHVEVRLERHRREPPRPGRKPAAEEPLPAAYRAAERILSGEPDLDRVRRVHLNAALSRTAS